MINYLLLLSLALPLLIILFRMVKDHNRKAAKIGEKQIAVPFTKARQPFTHLQTRTFKQRKNGFCYWVQSIFFIDNEGQIYKRRTIHHHNMK